MITNFKLFINDFILETNWKNKFRPITQLFNILPKTIIK